MAQYGFYFNSDVCTGCKTCQVACKENHRLPVDSLYRRVYNYQGGAWELNGAGTYVPSGMFGYFVSVACNHCAEPACAAACPTGAMQKDPQTGVVWTDHGVCIGCGSCAQACPYGAPVLDGGRGYMTKCDACRDDVAAGARPVCVAACPMRALDFGEYAELVERYGEGDPEVEPLPLASTSPCLVLKPHRRAQRSGEGTGSVANLPEEL